VAERERLRLLRIQALEALASELAEDRPEMGMLAAMSVVATEPLQESAWRLVVRIHVQQGNLSSAERSYAAYRSLLAAELGVEPSRKMEDLRASWCP
jgi:DNA-binding SARP family transcriptional activator